MHIRTDFPRAIRLIENTFIPLSDGTRLAARLWLPVDAETEPVPAILEYLPYRKNDATAQRDATRHAYYAGYGYACIRVDLRGSGDSDGILYDEYLKQEQDDALEVLQWIAAQPWCSGKVGMIGISWGGFNGLQVAARRPPELKAIITVCSTDDRYADDVHFIGGCLLALDTMSWATTMLALNARPPDPKNVGERWRQMWLERIEQSPPFVHAWLSHQRRDQFWQHGSVCEDFSAIECPVYAVGGWADAYTNAVPRLLAGLTAPSKGLIGPWAHMYPHAGIPGPAIGFMQESLRWWDHWLKGIDTGIMDEPKLRVWLQDYAPPSTHYEEWPGRWVADQEWPSSYITPTSFPLTLPPSHPVTPSPLHIRGAQIAGVNAGVWCPYGVPGDMPGDQREDDGLALCFESAPLSQPIDLLGFPEVTLQLAVDQPSTLVAVRLCDVAPTGESLLISWGLLNLTHRHNHEDLLPCELGVPFTVNVRLNALGHRLAEGHRWRVAISPTYWPMAWPSPKPVTLQVYAEQCHVFLPVRTPQATDQSLPAFLPPECAAPLPVEMGAHGAPKRTMLRDAISGLCERIDATDSGLQRFADGLEYRFAQTDIFRIREGDPLSATIRCERTVLLGRAEEWRTRIEAWSEMRCDETTFIVRSVVEAFEGDEKVAHKEWEFSTGRDLV